MLSQRTAAAAFYTRAKSATPPPSPGVQPTAGPNHCVKQLPVHHSLLLCITHCSTNVACITSFICITTPPPCRSQPEQQEAPQLTAVSTLLAAAAAAGQAAGHESDADQPQLLEEGQQAGVAVVQLPRSLVAAGLEELQQSQEQVLITLQKQVGRSMAPSSLSAQPLCGSVSPSRCCCWTRVLARPAV